MPTVLIVAAVVGYLLGALPFGFLVARAKGVNIFEVGSKNPGATNVRRVLGHGPGNLVLFLDAAKGALAVGWPLLPVAGPAGEGAAITGLVAAIVGHSFSCFTGFKGGKSVATAAGGFAVLFPLGAAIALGVFGLTLAIFRFVSLSSMLAAVSLVIAAVVLGRSVPVVVVTATIAGFVILRHRANISRLLAGTESRVGSKAPPPSASSSA
ncbi:MAG: acyl-phosphate glycerol 3-phosphate acyltransferase [Verrucomicrobiota bacterium]